MRQSYRDLWHLIGQCRPNLVELSLAVVLSLASAAALLGYPLLTQQLVDRLGAGEGTGPLGWLLIGLLLSGLLVSATATVMLARIGHDAAARLRLLIIGKMLKLPIGFFDQSNTGERVSRVINDCRSISGLITTQVSSLISGVLMLTGSVFILLWLDARLMLVLLVTLLAAVLIIVPAVTKLESVSKEVQEFTARLSGILTHVFSEMRLVKAYTAESRERERSRQVVGDLKNQGYVFERLEVIIGSVTGLAITGALTVILVYGGMRVGRGDLTVGVLTAFILYIFNVAGPLGQLAGFLAGLQTAKGASARLTYILQEPEEQVQNESRLLEPGSVLEFRQVTFRYPGSVVSVLEDFDLVIEPDTTTALVGISGSGKSSLLSLIERFYSPTAGEMLYDGRPLAEYDPTAWRRSIGYVAQSSPIMPGTVRDNITYGLDRPYSDDEVREAAAQAGALEFIVRMPEGLDTRLIEQGGNISGGQRQRIAIARVFLRDPNLLLLDEATSSLDSEAEHEILFALQRLMARRTNIVIAHRLSTVLHADRICFLEGGRISDIGTHEELCGRHPIYAQLVRRQFVRVEPKSLLPDEVENGPTAKQRA